MQQGLNAKPQSRQEAERSESAMGFMRNIHRLRPGLACSECSLRCNPSKASISDKMFTSSYVEKESGGGMLGRGTGRRTANLLTLLGLLLCLSWPQTLNATLIIILRHNDDLYVASDSVLSYARQKKSEKYTKCFPASKTGCVAISGYGGANGTIETTSNQIVFDSRFPQKLDEMAKEEQAKHELFSDSVTNILNRFAPVYKSLMELQLSIANNATNRERFDDTDIYFVGYDSSSTSFCQITARFPPLPPHNFVLERLAIPTSSIHFIGEYGFLSALMRGDDPRLKPLKSAALLRGLSPLPVVSSDLQAKTISDAILQLYGLHTKYSKRYNYDDGLVGPPYVIYRVSTNEVTRVYYGNGLATPDEEFLGILIFLIVLCVIIGAPIFAFRA
jgi:hypothetical protein